MIRHFTRLSTIAFRNVTRQKRRSLAVIVALALAVAALVATRGLINGVQVLMKRRVVYGQTGSVSIRAKGAALLAPAYVQTRVAQVTGVTASAPRMAFPLLASKGDHTLQVWAMAIDPHLDPLVCPAAADELARGTAVGEGTAVTTPGVLEALGAGLGDELVLLANDHEGVLNAVTVHLSGVTRGPPKQTAEERVMFIPLAVAQALARDEDRVGEVVVASDDPDSAPLLARQIAAALPGYDVRAWQEVAPFVVDIISNQERVLTVVALIFAIVAALGVSHALVLSVLGRRKELGTMLALGLRRRSLLLLVVCETAMLSVAAALLGAAIGGAAVGVAHAVGIPIVLPGADTADLVRPEIALVDILSLALLAICVSLPSSFLPARRAARATPQGVLVSR